MRVDGFNFRPIVDPKRRGTVGKWSIKQSRLPHIRRIVSIKVQNRQQRSVVTARHSHESQRLCGVARAEEPDAKS